MSGCHAIFEDRSHRARLLSSCIDAPNPRAKRVGARALTAAAITLVTAEARAEVIRVAPGDSFSKIEAARAGDEVVIAPGRYSYRVHLTEKATPDRPLVVRAEDPTHPPIWDLHEQRVEDAPGSSSDRLRGRGCWQIDGAAHIRISGIVFTGCRTWTHNSAGIRYYNGARGIVVRDCVFRENDNGLTGGTEQSEITVEHCEFDRNGNLGASPLSPSHNIYIYGGVAFTLRYSFVHDPIQAENFHVRARSSTIENNWFSGAPRYEGDLMTDDDVGVAGGHAGPYAQEMLFRGNVVVQSDHPTNRSQIIALFNDAKIAALSLRIRLLSNTIVVREPGTHVVHLSNADGTTMAAEISNNVLSDGAPASIDDEATGSVSGTSNWLATGTPPGTLARSVFGSAPPFVDLAESDLRLSKSGGAIGAADPTVQGLPDRELLPEAPRSRRYRVRASVRDIGAFESTSSDRIGFGADTPSLGGSVPAEEASRKGPTNPLLTPARLAGAALSLLGAAIALARWRRRRNVDRDP